MNKFFKTMPLVGLFLLSLLLFACEQSGSSSSPEPEPGLPQPEPDPQPASKDFLGNLMHEMSQDGRAPTQDKIDQDQTAKIIFSGLGLATDARVKLLHVKASGGSDENDGSSWSAAKATIKAALDAITDASANKVYVILLSSGTHTQTTTLSMKNHVAIIGGFVATGDSTINSYDKGAATAISGGHIPSDPDTGQQVFSNNGLDINNTRSTAVLARVAIRYGIAEVGGGMHNDSSSPILTRVIFYDNISNSGGGGMYNNNNSSPILTQVTFFNNYSIGGGGMYNESSSSPILTQVTFYGNVANGSGGGGMLNYKNSSPILTQVTFSNNGASTGGGGMYNESSSSPILTQVTFSENHVADVGGGMLNTHASSPVIAGAIFWGNTKGQRDAKVASQIENQTNSTYTIAHSVVQDATIDVAKGISNADPKLSDVVSGNSGGFVNPIVGVADNGGFVKTVTIGSGSSAINTGLYFALHIAADGTRTAYYSDDNVTWHTTPLLTDAGVALPTTGTTHYTTDARDYSYVNRPDIGAFEFDPLGNLMHKMSQDGRALTQDKIDQDQTAKTVFAGLDSTTDAEVKLLHVKASGGSDENDGSSWSAAKATIKAALDAITDASANKAYVILLSSGTHTPAATLSMKNHVAIIGGFVDDGYHRSTTTEINGSGKQVFSNNGLDINNTLSTAVLAQVTISNGEADTGGGMYNINSSPTLTQVIFSGNKASLNHANAYGGGAGMYNDSSSPILTQVTFSGNESYEGGGGMYNLNNSSPTLTQVSFFGNSSFEGGGGMFNIGSSPILTQVTFAGNLTSRIGGGGMYNYINSSPILMQVTFAGNTTGAGGGGMLNVFSSPILTQVTFSGNTANSTNGDGGGMLNNTSSSPIIAGAIFWGNTKGSRGAKVASQIDNDNNSSHIIAHSIVQDETIDTAKGISNADPKLSDVVLDDSGQFVDEIVGLADNGGFVKTVAIIGSDSSAINTGLYFALYIAADGTRIAYYSDDNATWHTTPLLTDTGVALPTTGTTHYTTDARDYSYVNRPDIGAFEYGASAP